MVNVIIIVIINYGRFVVISDVVMQRYTT